MPLIHLKDTCTFYKHNYPILWTLSVSLSLSLSPFPTRISLFSISFSLSSLSLPLSHLFLISLSSLSLSYSLGVTVLEGSSSDIHIIEYIFRHHSDLTAVVHCAAYSNPKGNSDNPIRGISDNVESLVNVLDIITKQKVGFIMLIYTYMCF